MFLSMLAQANSTFWMPKQASTVAGEVDSLFNLVLAISAFFFLLILVLVIVFAWRYRHRKGDERSRGWGHSTALELTWTLIPTVLVIIIFYDGFRSYMNMAVAPPNPYEIQVTAQMWSWSFTYPNGHMDTELHIPVNTPVRLILSSEDVIHSLYVPAFRIKRDVVPGRYNKMWFEATQTGEFDLFCAEYCGRNHSQMTTKVIVQEPHEFRQWLEEAANWQQRMTPLEAGKMLVSKLGCLQCHSTDGTILQAPSFKDLFGHEVPLSGGGVVVADENYIRESILYPQAKVVAGFNPIMPSFLGRVKDSDISAMITYFKSISTHFEGQIETTTQPAAGGAATQPASNQPVMQ